MGIMEIREYKSTDIGQIARLFHDTVHAVNRRDYTPEQLRAWATGRVDEDEWNAAFLRHMTYVAVEGDSVVGFGDMDATGYLDKLYVHKDRQGMGIATAICDRLESEVKADCFTVHASITARPFFEKRGYKVLKRQEVERRGVRLTNYLMQKRR